MTAFQVIERLLAQPGRIEAKADALYLKGVLQAAGGMADSAEKNLRRLVVEYPESDRIGPALTQLGILCNRRAGDSLAVIYLEPVAESFPDSAFTPAALLTLARSAERAGLDHKALSAYLQYLASGPAEDRDPDPHLLAALERSAALLYEAGRAQEAYVLLERIKTIKQKDLEGLDLSTQMLAIGTLTGLGMPDSSLRLAEELRRRSGDQMSGSPKLSFLLGHAHLAKGQLARADSAFTSLVAKENLESEGIKVDSLYFLLREIKLREGSYEGFFLYANLEMNVADGPVEALEILQLIVHIGIKTGSIDSAAEGIKLFFRRFGGYAATAREARICEARLLAHSGRSGRAIKLLGDLAAGEKEPCEFQARVKLIRSGLYLNQGDTLRAEAELLDCVDSQEDCLHNRDSVLWVYAGIKRDQGLVRREAELLEKLTLDYPASRYWERAGDRLEEIRLFELSDPARAAGELLDILSSRSGPVPPLQLADLAADLLGDYDRAIAILQQSPPQEPEARLKLIKYRYLAGLKLSRKGSVEGRERVSRAWQETGALLEQEGPFPGREQAVSLYLTIYKFLFNRMSRTAVLKADNVLKVELATLPAGAVRSRALSRLAEHYLAMARLDSGMAAFAF
ncbi:MAG: tetratricopeptide repeat protein, partial [Gemmatimonadota bacterium]|nr:tetratricopeptide repeat protein [Gemmatimonadota bacterium]